MPSPEDPLPHTALLYPQLWKQMQAAQSFVRLQGGPVEDGIRKTGGQVAHRDVEELGIPTS